MIVRTIWKFDVLVADQFELDMPADAHVISVQVQHGSVRMWAVVNPTAALTKRKFHVLGTGHAFKGQPGNFIGTFQLQGGDLVFHLFEAHSTTS